MINSTNDSLIAASFKLHLRTRRHKQYVRNEIEINCERPKGLRLDPEANCQFVRDNSYCNFDVNFINYLEFAVCTVRIDEYPLYGDIGYIACTILLLLISIFVFYIIAKWFILPNMITLYYWWPINEYQFGVIVASSLYVASYLFRSTFACNPPKERFSLFLTILTSKTLTMYGFGLALIAINKNLYIPPIRFILNMLVIIIGNIYVIILIYYKTKNDILPQNEQWDLKLGWHAKFHVAASLIYICIHFCSLYKTPKINQRTRPTLPMHRDHQEQFNINQSNFEVHTNRRVSFTTPIEGMEASEDVVEDLVRNVLVTNNLTTVYSAFKANLKTFYVEMFGKRCIFLKILLSPIWIILTLLIPVIEENRPFYGWNKYLLCLNCCCLPILLFPYSSMGLLIISFTVGFLMAFSLLVGTGAKEPPIFYKLFSVIGLLASFKICHILEMETGTLIQQSLQYSSGWNIDAVVVFGSSFFSCVSEMILLYLLIQDENIGIACGIVSGLAMYNTLGGLPSIIFHASFKETSMIFITKNNVTVYVFLFLIVTYIFISVISSNLELRYSHGIFLFIFCSLFLLYILFSGGELIHPYGSQHDSTSLYDSLGHSRWA